MTYLWYNESRDISEVYHFNSVRYGNCCHFGGIAQNGVDFFEVVLDALFGELRFFHNIGRIVENGFILFAKGSFPFFAGLGTGVINRAELLRHTISDGPFT